MNESSSTSYSETKKSCLYSVIKMYLLSQKQLFLLMLEKAHRQWRIVLFNLFVNHFSQCILSFAPYQSYSDQWKGDISKEETLRYDDIIMQ